MTGLHNVPLVEALAVKWDKGVEEVRGDKKEWVGGPPMEEAYEEILDMINYTREAYRQGYLKEYEAYFIEREAKGLIQTIRRYIDNKID